MLWYAVVANRGRRRWTALVAKSPQDAQEAPGPPRVPPDDQCLTLTVRTVMMDSAAQVWATAGQPSRRLSMRGLQVDLAEKGAAKAQ